MHIAGWGLGLEKEEFFLYPICVVVHGTTQCLDFSCVGECTGVYKYVCAVPQFSFFGILRVVSCPTNARA